MTDLEVLLGAINDTLIVWEPDDAARRVLELLRRNLIDRMTASPDEEPF